MALGQTLVSAALLLVLLASVGESVKECHRCFSAGATCQSPGKVSCNRNEAIATAAQIGAIYPNISIHAPASNDFSCISVTGLFPDGGVNNITGQIKGCIFKTDGKLCGSHNRNFSITNCNDCNSDNCNGALAMGANVLFLAVGYLTVRFIS